MTERKPDSAADGFTPETTNTEQVDVDTQAQTVADQARAASTSTMSLEESTKENGGIEDVDAQDLVDHMNQMERSGTIDMSAFRGEDSHDDLEGRHGRASAPDPEFSGDDS